MPTILSTLAPLFRALHHHLHPVTHHRIHHHIEYGGGERISLRHSSSSLKRHTIIAARPCYYCQPPPIRPEEPTGSGYHSVTFQDLKASGPVQGVIRLVQVRKYHVHDLLPKGRTHFIWFCISMYVNNGTTKVPITGEIRSRVQRSNSKISN